MDMIIDKTDNYEVYFTHWVDGFSFTLESPALPDFIILVGYDERDSEDGDKRKKIIDIDHLHNGRDTSKDHKLNLCIDMKNHAATTPLHLNVSWSAKNISCPVCKSLTEDYPSGLNHMPIRFTIGEGGGNPYKIVDMHSTIEEILNLIRSKDELKKYSTYKLGAVSPSDSYWINTLSSRL